MTIALIAALLGTCALAGLVLGACCGWLFGVFLAEVTPDPDLGRRGRWW